MRQEHESDEGNNYGFTFTGRHRYAGLRNALEVATILETTNAGVQRESTSCPRYEKTKYGQGILNPVITRWNIAVLEKNTKEVVAMDSPANAQLTNLKVIAIGYTVGTALILSGIIGLVITG